MPPKNGTVREIKVNSLRGGYVGGQHELLDHTVGLTHHLRLHNLLNKPTLCYNSRNSGKNHSYQNNQSYKKINRTY